MMSKISIDSNDKVTDEMLEKAFSIKIDHTVDRDRIEQEYRLMIGTGWIKMMKDLEVIKEIYDDFGLAPFLRNSLLGASYVAYLKGFTIVNPLKSHYKCMRCGRIEYIKKGSYINDWLVKEDVKSGYDLNFYKHCRHCGMDMYADGHDIPPELCFREKTLSKETKAVVEYCVPKGFKEKAIDKFAEQGHQVSLSNSNPSESRRVYPFSIIIDGKSEIKFTETIIEIPKEWFEDYKTRCQHFYPTFMNRKFSEYLREEVFSWDHMIGDDRCDNISDREEVMNRAMTITNVIFEVYSDEKRRKSILYKGIFWIQDTEYFDNNCNIIRARTNIDGSILEEGYCGLELTSRAGDNFNHEKSWNELHEWTTRNKPFDYYPRGRVEIRHGKAIIYANPNICGEKLIEWCKEKFNLFESNGITDIRCKPDHSEHYKCWMDREGDA